MSRVNPDLSYNGKSAIWMPDNVWMVVLCSIIVV